MGPENSPAPFWGSEPKIIFIPLIVLPGLCKLIPRVHAWFSSRESIKFSVQRGENKTQGEELIYLALSFEYKMPQPKVIAKSWKQKAIAAITSPSRKASSPPPFVNRKPPAFKTR